MRFIIMKKSSSAGRALCLVVAAAFTCTQVLFAQAPEKNLWAERRRARTAASAALLARWNGAAALHADVVAKGLPAAPAFPLKKLGIERAAPRLAALAAALSAHGVVRDIRPAPGDAPVYIYVQDVHGHKRAQENIAAMLLKVWEIDPGAPLGLEGAEGGIISADSFRGPSARANEEAGHFFFNAGHIGGAELAAFAAPREPACFGLEDKRLYLQNVEAARGSLSRRAQGLAEVQRRNALLEERKAAEYSPVLRELDRKVRAHYAHEISLGDYLAYLSPTAQGRAGYPQTDLFLKTWRMETSLDFQAVEDQRNRFLAGLAGGLPEEDLRGLLDRSVAFRMGRIPYAEYYHGLAETAARGSVDLSAFPQFAEYVRYALLADSIKPEALFAEMSRLEKSAWDSRLENPRQRQVYESSQDLLLAEKLVRLVMTPEDWKEYKKREAGRNAEWAPFEAFYESAEARNRALADNFLRGAARGHGKRRAPSTAVLVAGGFHAESVVRRISGKATLVTVTPKLDMADPGQAGEYLDVFTRGKLPLDKLFESPRITLADTPAIAPIGGAKAFVLATARALEEAAEAAGGRVEFQTPPSGDRYAAVYASGRKEVPSGLLGKGTMLAKGPAKAGAFAVLQNRRPWWSRAGAPVQTARNILKNALLERPLYLAVVAAPSAALMAAEALFPGSSMLHRIFFAALSSLLAAELSAARYVEALHARTHSEPGKRQLRATVRWLAAAGWVSFLTAFAAFHGLDSAQGFSPAALGQAAAAGDLGFRAAHILLNLASLIHPGLAPASGEGGEDAVPARTFTGEEKVRMQIMKVLEVLMFDETDLEWNEAKAWLKEKCIQVNVPLPPTQDRMDLMRRGGFELHPRVSGEELKELLVKAPGDPRIFRLVLDKKEKAWTVRVEVDGVPPNEARAGASPGAGGAGRAGSMSVSFTIRDETDERINFLFRREKFRSRDAIVEALIWEEARSEGFSVREDLIWNGERKSRTKPGKKAEQTKGRSRKGFKGKNFWIHPDSKRILEDIMKKRINEGRVGPKYKKGQFLDEAVSRAVGDEELLKGGEAAPVGRPTGRWLHKFRIKVETEASIDRLVERYQFPSRLVLVETLVWLKARQRPGLSIREDLIWKGERRMKRRAGHRTEERQQRGDVKSFVSFRFDEETSGMINELIDAGISERSVGYDYDRGMFIDDLISEADGGGFDAELRAPTADGSPQPAPAPAIQAPGAEASGDLDGAAAVPAPPVALLPAWTRTNVTGPAVEMLRRAREAAEWRRGLALSQFREKPAESGQDGPALGPRRNRNYFIKVKTYVLIDKLLDRSGRESRSLLVEELIWRAAGERFPAVGNLSRRKRRNKSRMIWRQGNDRGIQLGLAFHAATERMINALVEIWTGPGMEGPRRAKLINILVAREAERLRIRADDGNEDPPNSLKEPEKKAAAPVLVETPNPDLLYEGVRTALGLFTDLRRSSGELDEASSRLRRGLEVHVGKILIQATFKGENVFTIDPFSSRPYINIERFRIKLIGPDAVLFVTPNDGVFRVERIGGVVRAVEAPLDEPARLPKTERPSYSPPVPPVDESPDARTPMGPFNVIMEKERSFFSPIGEYARIHSMLGNEEKPVPVEEMKMPRRQAPKDIGSAEKADPDPDDSETTYSLAEWIAALLALHGFWPEAAAAALPVIAAGILYAARGLWRPPAARMWSALARSFTGAAASEDPFRGARGEDASLDEEAVRGYESALSLSRDQGLNPASAAILWRLIGDLGPPQAYLLREGISAAGPGFQASTPEEAVGQLRRDKVWARVRSLLERPARKGVLKGRLHDLAHSAGRMGMEESAAAEWMETLAARLGLEGAKDSWRVHYRRGLRAGALDLARDARPVVYDLGADAAGAELEERGLHLFNLALDADDPEAVRRTLDELPSFMAAASDDASGYALLARIPPAPAGESIERRRERRLRARRDWLERTRAEAVRQNIPAEKLAGLGGARIVLVEAGRDELISLEHIVRALQQAGLAPAGPAPDVLAAVRLGLYTATLRGLDVRGLVRAHLFFLLKDKKAIPLSPVLERENRLDSIRASHA